MKYLAFALATLTAWLLSARRFNQALDAGPDRYNPQNDDSLFT